MKQLHHLPSERRRAAILRGGIIAGSGCLTVIGVFWSLRPESMPFVGNARLYAEVLLPRAGLGPLLLLAGALGVVTGLLVHRLPRLAVRTAAWVEATILLIAYQGAGTIGALGYSAAYAIPVIVVVLVVLVVSRSPRWRWPVAGVVLVAAGAGLWSGLLAPATLAATFGNVVLVVTANPFIGYVPVLLAVGLVWVAVLVRSHFARLSQLSGWVLRHRRPITYAAALCAAPYAVARLLWLTPFQIESLLDLPGDPVVLDLRTRLWGVSLGLACLGGGVLTTGLVSRWGEVFPHWLPGLAGRPVPIALAAAPGFLVAAGFLVMTPTSVIGFFTDWPVGLVATVLFPFPVWGVLLALAVSGYIAHRLGSVPSRGPGSGTRELRQPDVGPL